MKKIRLRYAPSPTGYLHIGNTRTALMNFLFAKHYNGDFIVRIEDTDLERNVADAIDSQFDNLNWLNIIADESIYNPVEKYGKYMQSEKLGVYQKHVDYLLESKKAYRCFCTPEELEKERELQTSQGIVATRYSKKCLNLSEEELEKNIKNQKEYSVRFLVPENTTYKINDLVRGEIIFDSKEISDFVILKSNKIPTYNFAVVVDDKDMEITHVVRGEEHISNTPKQIMIYNAFGWDIPVFCHLTLIVDETKKKLSKRSGNSLFFISQYKSQGYLPEAVFNFISLLGWSPKEEREIYTIEELIEIFDETRFSKSPSTFDMGKLKWMNNQWMKRIDDNKYLNFIYQFVDKEIFNIETLDKVWLDQVFMLFKNEISCGNEINQHLDIFINDVQVSEDTKSILNEIENWKNMIVDLKNKIEQTNDFNVENIKSIIKNIGEEHNKKGRNLFMPIRIATTSSEHGPELAKVISLLGKTKVLNNIQKII